MITPIPLYQQKSEKIIRHSLNNAFSSIEKLDKALKEKGFEFNRNHKIGNYSFDFYCSKYRIAIEIDGYAHEFDDIFSKDTLKKLYIQSLDIVVLKFTDYQILTDIEEIYRALKYQEKLSN